MTGAAAQFPTQVAAPRFEWLRTPWSIRLPQILVALFVIAIGFLVCYPLVMLLLGSFAHPKLDAGLGYSERVLVPNLRRRCAVSAHAERGRGRIQELAREPVETLLRAVIYSELR